MGTTTEAGQLTAPMRATVVLAELPRLGKMHLVLDGVRLAWRELRGKFAALPTTTKRPRRKPDFEPAFTRTGRPLAHARGTRLVEPQERRPVGARLCRTVRLPLRPVGIIHLPGAGRLWRGRRRRPPYHRRQRAHTHPNDGADQGEQHA